jgi:uncharacterized protein
MKLPLLIGLTSLVLSAPALAQEKVFEAPYWTKSPVIEALGRAELEVAPNRAGFSVEFRQTGTKADIAMQAAVERARIAYDTIKKIAGDSARITSSVSVEPYYKQYRDRKGERIENDRADKVDGYAATASLKIVMLDVGKAGDARAAALTLGPEKSSALRVYLERTAAINRKAYEAAVEDGALRAKASAKAAGAKLGPLMVLQEGNGPCLGQWSARAGRVRQNYPKMMRRMAAPPPNAEVAVTAARLKNGKEIIITQADIDALNIPSDPAPKTVSANVCMVYSVAP